MTTRNRLPSSISLSPPEREALVYLAKLDDLPLSREVAKLIRDALEKQLELEAAQGIDAIPPADLRDAFDEIRSWRQ